MKLLKSSCRGDYIGTFLLGILRLLLTSVWGWHACNKMTPMEGIEATVGQVTKALIAINANAGGDVVINDIKDALKLSKEINANDKVDRYRNRANDYLKKAREAVKDGDLTKATEHLKEAEKRFLDLKGMIDLTLDDRVSQQTPMINRILDKPDR